MKSKILTFVCLLGTFFTNSQNNDVQTKSVLIDNLIPFLVENIESKDDDSAIDPEHFVFLLQSPIGDLNTEDKVILKQGFKLVSKKLTNEDQISIIAYSGVNGIVLNSAFAKNLKDILFSIENLKSSIKEPKHDGIEIAYAFADTLSQNNKKCTIIMVRNPKTMIARSDTLNAAQNPSTADKSTKGNAVLLTAISLLPQIISVIKD